MLSATPTAIPRVLGVLRVDQPNVIHLEFNIPALGATWLWVILAACVDPRQSGARVVIPLDRVHRDLTMLRGAVLLCYRRLAQVTDAAIVYTDEARQHLLDGGGASDFTIVLIPHGAPVGPLVSDGQPTEVLMGDHIGRKQLLYFGYIHSNSGVQLIVRAVTILNKRAPGLVDSLRIVVFGDVRKRRGALPTFALHDKRYKRELAKAIRASGVSDNLRFVGSVDVGHVDLLLALARIAVLPYVQSIQGGVLNLRVAAHTQVAATNLFGLVEPLGAAGVFDSSRDVEGRATAVGALRGDGDRRAAIRNSMTVVHQWVAFRSIVHHLFGLDRNEPPADSGGTR